MAVTPLPWRLTIAAALPRANAILRGHWTRRHALQTEWQWLVRDERLRRRVPPATGKRRVDIVRVYGHGCRVYDPDNLSLSCKFLIDALRNERLLVNDTPECLDLHVSQERGGRRSMVEIYIRDLSAVL